MKFGVRECANIVFRAKQPIRIGTATFQAGQPVLYIDSATTSSLEQATTTVYAQGGRGNVRLLAWEGEKTLTFSFTDALLSPIGFAILSGAGLFKRGNGNQGSETGDLVHFHMTSGANLDITSKTTGEGNDAVTTYTGTIDLRSAIAEFGANAKICENDAPLYVMETEPDGSLTGNVYSGTLNVDGGYITISNIRINNTDAKDNAAVMVDYYVDLPGKHVWEADITPETFGGNYYVEADTLFRDQHTGKDLPANLTFPNVRLQSNFTMTFAGSGDPSTFDFTMDAFPDFTYFDQKKKVLCAMQIVDSIALGAESAAVEAEDPVMYHDESPQHAEASAHDSNKTIYDAGYRVTAFDWADSSTFGGAETGPKEITLYHLNDTLSIGSLVKIMEGTKETSLSAYNPEFTITYNNNEETGATYAKVSSDGLITVKKNTGLKGSEGAKPIVIKTELTQAGNEHAGIEVELRLYVYDQSVEA